MAASFGNSPSPPQGGMPFTSVWQTLQNLVNAVTSIGNSLKAAFPQSTGTANSATAGSQTLPAAPAGFVVIYVPSLNASVKVPYYNT